MICTLDSVDHRSGLPPITVPDSLRDALAILIGACRSDERVRAAWLEGSLARDEADDWSDIDLHVRVSEESSFDAAMWLRDLFALVLLDRVPGLSTTYIAITPEWVHIDLTVESHDEPPSADRPRIMLLDRCEATPAHVVQPADTPLFSVADARVFLYLMGVGLAAHARGDAIAHAQTVTALRDRHLLPVLLAENGQHARRAKRLGRLLTAEQRAALAAIPPIGLDARALLEAQTVIAHEYLPRAKRLIAAQHLEWPEALELATGELWTRQLGVGFA